MTDQGNHDNEDRWDADDEYGEGWDCGGCNTCGGQGFIVVCVDDMCRGAGECFHGDGEAPCPDCDGE